jgi:hypothetical protein
VTSLEFENVRNGRLGGDGSLIWTKILFARKFFGLGACFLTDFLVRMMLSSRARDRWPGWADEDGRWMMRREKDGEDGEDEWR